MNITNTKLYVSASIAVLAIMPKLTYKASEYYIKGYNTSSSYISATSENLLYKIGLQSIPPDSSYDTLILEAGNKYRVNPKLLTALIGHESHKDSDAYSPKGAIGVAQIMPENAKRCGFTKISKLWDDRNNINCGAQILSEELITYKGNLKNALRAYNGGPKCVTGSCKESENHSSDIINRLAQASVQ